MVWHHEVYDRNCGSGSLLGLLLLTWFNLSPPSAAYMRQWTGSPLVQVKACRLFGAKPLPEQMLHYCQWDSWEHISIGILSFSVKKMHLKMPSANMAAILFRGDELTQFIAWISNYISGFVWDAITLPCPKWCTFHLSKLLYPTDS